LLKGRPVLGDRIFECLFPHGSKFFAVVIVAILTVAAFAKQFVSKTLAVHLQAFRLFAVALGALGRRLFLGSRFSLGILLADSWSGSLRYRSFGLCGLGFMRETRRHIMSGYRTTSSGTHRSCTTRCSIVLR